MLGDVVENVKDPVLPADEEAPVAVTHTKDVTAPAAAITENNKKRKFERATLPIDVWQKILSQINLSDIGECARVSKSWNAHFQDDLFWKSLLMNNYGGRVTERTQNYLTYKEAFRGFVTFETLPEPRKKSKTVVRGASVVQYCTISPNGDHAAIAEGGEDEENLRCVKLKAVFVKQNRCKILLNYSEGLHGFLPSGVIEYPRFNRTGEHLFVLAARFESRMVTGQVSEIVTFNAPRFNIGRRIPLNTASVNMSAYNPVWLGDKTILGRASHGGYECPINRYMKVWSTRSLQDDGHTLVDRFKGVSVGHNCIVNNLTTGMRELIQLEGSPGNPSRVPDVLVLQPVKGHGHDPGHHCERCSPSGGCVIADYSSDNASSFSLHGDRKEAVQPGLLGAEGYYDDRVFVFWSDEEFEEDERFLIGNRFLTEFDLSLVRLRQWPVQDLLQLPSTSVFLELNCTFMNGLLVFTAFTIEHEDADLVSRVTLWEPGSDAMVHRKIEQHPSYCRSYGEDSLAGRWYVNLAGKVFLATDTNNDLHIMGKVDKE